MTRDAAFTSDQIFWPSSAFSLSYKYDAFWNSCRSDVGKRKIVGYFSPVENFGDICS